MSLFSLEVSSFSVLALGAAGLATGLLVVLFAPRRASARAGRALALATALGVAAEASLLAGLPKVVWVPLFGLAAAWALFGLARLAPPLGDRTGALAGRTARRLSLATGYLARHPRGQGLSLCLAGAALVGWQAYQIQREIEPQDFPPDPLAEINQPVDIVAARDIYLLTDTGSRVPVYRPFNPDDNGPAWDWEGAWLCKHGLDRHVIATDGPTVVYNCHGWVFTGGRCWVRNKTVKMLVAENGYQTVRQPRPGDLALFRDTSGEFVHSAVVSSVSASGQVLLESKFGRAGRYLHTAEKHAYPECSLTYYRSPRQGHLLRGQDGAGPAPAAPSLPGA
jgi:hypothetical protein